MDFGTASQAKILTARKSDFANVSKSTISLKIGSILTLEKSIFSTAFAAGAAAEDLEDFLSESKDFIVGNKILLSPSRPMPLRSAQNPHNCWVFETIYHSSCVLFDRPLHSKSCIKIVVVCRHIFL